MSLGSVFLPSNTTSTIALSTVSINVPIAGQGNAVWVGVVGNTAGAWVTLSNTSTATASNTTLTTSTVGAGTVGLFIPPSSGMLISAPWEPTGTAGYMAAISTNTAGWVAATAGWGTVH
jgi:hypothetical protein